MKRKSSKLSRLTITYNCYNPNRLCREQYSFSFLIYIGKKRTNWLLISTRGAGHGIAKDIRSQFPHRVGAVQKDREMTCAKVRKTLERKFSFILDLTTNSYANPDPKNVCTYTTFCLITPLRAHPA